MNNDQNLALSKEDIIDLITVYDALTRLNDVRDTVQPPESVYGGVDLNEQVSLVACLLWRKAGKGCSISSCVSKDDMDKLFTCPQREFYSILDAEDLTAGERYDLMLKLEYGCEKQ